MYGRNTGAVLLATVVLTIVMCKGEQEPPDLKVLLTQFNSPEFMDNYPPLSANEKGALLAKTKEMFYHAYDSYMNHAFPHDEIMPATCKPRIRGVSPSRGHIDEVLGRYMLTLIDSLDTLIVMEEYEDFMYGVKNVVERLDLESNFIVNIFEVNIRIVAGLISSHLFAKVIEEKGLSTIPQFRYEGQLLDLAIQVADRLLPAFDSPTGIPYSTLYFKTGLNNTSPNSPNTCPATAGTFILEFGALSRLTGNPVYEQKARDALLALWRYRNHDHDLWGSLINVETGKWVRKDSQIGAGVDSYLEYLFKAYVLLGHEEYLDMFETYYKSILTYMESNGVFYAVNSDMPSHTVHVYVDTFTAFFPGLQVMKGDISGAIRSFLPFFAISSIYTFVPEAFTGTFKIHWPYFSLRPEYIESAYFLYKATKNDFFLHIGKQFLLNIERHCKVKCGYTTLVSLNTLEKGDGMDSFFLAETMKYLYMMFSDESRHSSNSLFSLDEYVLTTEAHFLPLYLQNVKHDRQDKHPFVPSRQSPRYSLPHGVSRMTCPASTNMNDMYIRARFSPPISAPKDADEVKFCPIHSSLRYELLAKCRCYNRY